jgi:hypothetical protein
MLHFQLYKCRTQFDKTYQASLTLIMKQRKQNKKNTHNDGAEHRAVLLKQHSNRTVDVWKKEPNTSLSIHSYSGMNIDANCIDKPT